jgi:hypothetical protein
MTRRAKKDDLTRIADYGFGSITIGQHSFTTDVIIRPESVRDHWWRKTGHSVCLDDLGEVLADPPARLLLGQGHTGLMRVPEGVRTALEERGIEVAVMPTAEAVKVWNEWLDAEGAGLDAAAAFHLTC